MKTLEILKIQHELILKKGLKDISVGYINLDFFDEMEEEIQLNFRLGHLRYGLSFYNKYDVFFKSFADRCMFLDNFEELTSTLDLVENVSVTINDKENANPYVRILKENDDGRSDQINVIRELMETKYNYSMGNVDVKLGVKVQYANYGLVGICVALMDAKEFEDFCSGVDRITSIEFGFLVNISGNLVFLNTQEELRGFLKDLTLGEDDLCSEGKTFKITEEDYKTIEKTYKKSL